MEEERAEKLSNLFNEITPFVIFEIAAAIAVTWVFIRFTQWSLPLLSRILPARMRAPALNAVPLLQVTALLVLILWITPLVFNVTLQNFLFIAGALSVAIGFALKDLARSVIAGLIALFETPYRLGDWITIGKYYGEVINVNMRALRLRTPDDDVVTIPHDRIWSDNIANSNDGVGTLMCVARFYVARNQSMDRVRPLLRAVARTSPHLNLDRQIVVVAENSPFCTVYSLKAYPFEPRNQFAFITDMTERGNAALLEAGIESACAPPEMMARGGGGREGGGGRGGEG